MANRQTYVRVFDDIADHPAFMQVGAEGLGLWLMSLTYCSRNLTDGHFPNAAVKRWVDEDAEGPALLVMHDRWHLPGHDCAECPEPAKGYLYVHGYLDVQRSRDQVAELSAKRAEAGKLGGQTKAANQSGSKSVANAKQDSGNSYPYTDTETKKDSTSDADAPTREDVARICTHLADRIEANSGTRPAIGKGWHDAARLLLDRDGYTLEQALWLIDKAQADEFWRSNILSVPTLRKQALRLKMKFAGDSPTKADAVAAVQSLYDLPPLPEPPEHIRDAGGKAYTEWMRETRAAQRAEMAGAR